MPRASRRVALTSHCPPLAPHVAYASRCAPLHSRGPTSVSWHRALCRREAPHHRASIGGQQVDKHMLQPHISCFRCMLHTFHLNVAKVDLVLHILQLLYTYGASVCFKCFGCFKRMLQVFYLDIAYVAPAIHVCYKCIFQIFQLFQTYVANILSRCCSCYSAHTYIASVCCKCFIYFRRMLQ